MKGGVAKPVRCTIYKYRSTDGKIIFYPLHFSAEVFGLAVLARTERLHSAAVRDIVLLQCIISIIGT
jgi:hypothetical protein